MDAFTLIYKLFIQMQQQREREREIESNMLHTYADNTYTYLIEPHGRRAMID